MSLLPRSLRQILRGPDEEDERWARLLALLEAKREHLDRVTEAKREEMNGES